jgi:glutamine amidotransferase
LTAGLRVGVMDYGMGNLRSVEKAFERAGARAFVSDRPSALKSSDLLVVPGVGAFDAAMGVLRKKGLDRFIIDWVQADRPYFGICLGLQLLFESSAEAPGVRGLGVLAGKVVKFPFRRQGLKVPHMGWNQVRPVSPGPAGWNGLLSSSDHYYFVHFVLSVSQRRGSCLDGYTVRRAFLFGGGPRPTGGHPVSSGKKRPHGPSFLDAPVGARIQPIEVIPCL